MRVFMRMKKKKIKNITSSTPAVLSSQKNILLLMCSLLRRHAIRFSDCIDLETNLT